MKTGGTKLLAALVGAVLGVSTLTACTTNEVDLEIIGEPTTTVTYDEEMKEYTVVLEGLAKNASGQNCDNAWIDVQFYDELGDPIYTGSEWIEYIDAGETWHFYIERVFEYAPTRFEIEEAHAQIVTEDE
jgi:hypothetical protein